MDLDRLPGPPLGADLISDVGRNDEAGRIAAQDGIHSHRGIPIDLVRQINAVAVEKVNREQIPQGRRRRPG